MEAIFEPMAGIIVLERKNLARVLRVYEGTCHHFPLMKLPISLELAT